MKKIFFNARLLILALFVFSCSKYDDSELRNQIDALDGRVTSIERQLLSLNQDLNTINSLVQALQKNLYITDVIKSAGAHTIKFSDNSEITIFDGKDGKNAPVISTRFYNGNYYWVQTLAGVETWLYDAQGELIPAAGITPVLKVDSDGYWIVSYDNTYTYSKILDSEGKPVKASADPGESFFEDVIVSNGELRLILVDGTEIVISIGEQSIHRAVNLGLSVRWSSTNLGASLPSDRGDHFFWGDPEDKGIAGNYNAPDFNSIVGTPYDMARHVLKDTWRLPTKAEQEELALEGKWTRATVNGVNGRRVTGKNGNSIFLPNTGMVFPMSGPIGTTQLVYEDSGYYWTGEAYYSPDFGHTFAYNFHFDASNHYYNYSYNTMVVKMAVRPVKD